MSTAQKIQIISPEINVRDQDQDRDLTIRDQDRDFITQYICRGRPGLAIDLSHLEGILRPSAGNLTCVMCLNKIMARLET